MSLIINNSIINTYINNNNSNYIGLKLSGKGKNDYSNITNIYDYNGFGIYLSSNTCNYREIAFIDSCNTSNYPNLYTGIVSNTVKINNGTSLLQINNCLSIFNNNIGIEIINPYSALHIKSNVTLTGLLLDKNSNIITNNLWISSSKNLYYSKGFIGIGTSNPNSLLDIVNSSIILSSNYKIGIGKTNPQYALDIFNNDVNIENGALFCSLVNSKIGVGNTNPQSSLDVIGDISLSGTLLNTNGTPYIFKTLNPDQWSNSPFNYNNIYYNYGYVGIGVANPLSSLNINGNIRIDGNIVNKDGTIFNGSTWNNIIINNNKYIYNNNNIGIGTNVPIDLLHLTLINSNLNIRLTDATTNHTLNDGFIIGLDSNQNGCLWNYENASLIFGTSNKEQLQITNNGNIGIGTTNPQSLLHIVSSNKAFIAINDISISTSNGLIIGKDSNQYGLLWNYEKSDLIFGTSNEEKVRIKGDTFKINYINSIKKYPPKTYTTSTEVNTTTSILNGRNVYTQNFTLNTDGITYGNGDYIIYFSSYYDNNDGLSIKHLFNNINDNNAHFQDNQFDNTNGNYLGDNYIINNYYGDWVIIKLPYEIILKKYIYQARNVDVNLVTRSPGEWNVYGSIDGNNFIKIDTGKATVYNYIDNKCEKTINNNNSYLYYGFVINKLASPVDSASVILNFSELELYGYEKSDILLIDEINKIGIGTSNPNSLLHLYKSGLLSQDVLLSFNDQISGTNNIQIGKKLDNNAVFWNSNNNPLTFKTNNIERLRILNNGNIGIGIANPTSLLHLSSLVANSNLFININNGLIIGKDSNHNGLFLNYNDTSVIFGNNNTEKMRINANLKLQNHNELKTLFTSKPVWGMYFAEDYNNNLLLDCSGNNRHASTSSGISKTINSGNGSTAPINYIYGDTLTSINFPEGSVPSSFTILSLTRYVGENYGRILQASATDFHFIHGHHNIKRGLCYYDGWKTGENSTGTLTDWLCCIGTNGTATYNNNYNKYNNVLIDGIPIGTVLGGRGNTNLTINNSVWREYSEWALSCVIIWDNVLNEQEMIILNNLIDIYKSTGINIRNYILSLLGNNNNYNIGIGINNPNSLLHLYKSGLSSQDVLLSFNDQVTGTNIIQIGKNVDNNAVFWNSNNNPLTFKTNNIERLRILNNGNIGIGIANPTSLLHLSSLVANSNLFINIDNGLLIGKDSNQCGLLWNNSNNDLIFATNNQEKIRIKNTSFIGIGTDNPNSLLHLYKAGLSSQDVLLSFNDQVTGTNVIQIGKKVDNNVVFWNSNNNPLTFKTNNIERLRILNNGNIGIGIANPTSLLDINGNINIEGGLSIGSSSAFINNTNIDTDNTSNTYLILKHAGSTNDWCYIRQTGDNDKFKLSFDFYDNSLDNRFAIRYIIPILGTDTVKEVFKVDGLYTYANGLRLNGEDTTDTIMQTTSNLGITVNNENNNYISFNITSKEVLRITSENININSNITLKIIAPNRGYNPAVAINGSLSEAIILYQGNASTYAYSIGQQEIYIPSIPSYQNFLYFSIPNNSSHKFYINGNERLNIQLSIITIYNNIEISNNVNPGLSFTSFVGSDIGVASSSGSYSTSANSEDMIIRSQVGKKLILQTGNNEGSLIINNGNIGIGTNNPISILDVRKDNIRLSGNIYKTDGSLFIIDGGANASISSSNLLLKTNIETTLSPSYNNDNKYYLFEKDGSITFNKAISVDILVIGAGGNGGFGPFSGGGGAGEVIYYSKYTFTPGTYNLTIGVNLNKNSKITLNSSEIIKALGGGNGGYINIIFDRAVNIIDVNYKYVSYNNDGTFIINNSLICDILVVGGGGAGGTNSYWGGGGGGAGAVIYLTNQILTAGKYNVNIGLGGSPTDGTGNNGYDTKITNINNSKIIYLAKGGGGGGGSGGGDGLSGGSTGGGSVSGGQASLIVYNTENIPNGIYGNYGGTGNFHTIYRSGFGSGGGGGAGEVGGNAYYTYITVFTKSIGGKGGDGIQISITGTNEFYGGGGGGSISVSGLNIGLGGSGGGGNGSTTGDASRGTDNTGGGGGGGAGAGSSSSGWGYGGNGGSGIVIIRYNVNQEIIQPTTGGSGGGGYGGTTQQSKSTQGLKWNNSNSYVNDGYDGTLTKGGDGGSALLNNSYIEQLTQQNFKVGKGGYGFSNITNNFLTTKKNYGDGGDGGGGIGGKGIIIIKPNTTNSLIATDVKLKTLNINNLNNNLTNYNYIYPYCSCNINYIDNSNYGYYIITSSTNITFKKNTLVDILLVGPGGNGGNGENSGGGGAGDVLYFPNYLFTYGIYNFDIDSYRASFSQQYTINTSSEILIVANIGLPGISANGYSSNNYNGSGGGGYANLINGTNYGRSYTNFNKYNILNNTKQYYLYKTSGTNGTASSGGNGGSALLSGGFIEPLTGTNILVGVGGTGAIGSSSPSIKTSYGNGGDGNNGTGSGAVIIIKFPIEKINVFNCYELTNNKYLKTINNTINNYNAKININYDKCNIGIGISNPSSLLHINSNIMLSGYIRNYDPNLIINTSKNTKIIISSNINSNISISSGLTTFEKNNVYIIGNLTVIGGNITVNSGCNINIIGGGGYKINNNLFSTSSSGTFSDNRIKTNIIDITNSKASLLISAITPKIYNYIDKEERGFDTVYGFIAQQIEEVIPSAIQIITEFIPNIYKSFTYDNNQIITDEDLTTQLLINNKIKFKDNDNYYKTAIITTITSSNITINTAINGSNCFIYGKEIQDFHTLDKSFIYTANIGATQDLYNKIKFQEKQLQELNTIFEQQETIFNEISQTLNI